VANSTVRPAFAAAWMRSQNRPPGLHVHRHGRLQDLWVAGQRERELHPLHLAAGELLDPLVQDLGHPRLGHHLAERQRVRVQRADEFHHLAHVHVGLGTATVGTTHGVARPHFAMTDVTPAASAVRRCGGRMPRIA